MPPSPAPVADAAGSPSTAGAAPVVLRVQNLHKWYGKVHALDGVNLEIRKGEIVGFLGPNGAGKTTFTKCVTGFLSPTNGQVELFGQDMLHPSRAVLERVGIVPDQYDFYGNLNGVQHLEFYGRLYGVPRNHLRHRVDEVLQAVSATEFARRKVRGYSHGMKQRLCIAQALLNKPEFIIFDEPTNGLDPRGAFETRQLLKRLAKDGATVFLSSHILTEVEDVCNRVAILSRGRVLVQATVADLRKSLSGGAQRVTVTLENPSARLVQAVLQKKVAVNASLAGNQLVAELGPHHNIPDLVKLLVEMGARIRGVAEEQVGLEQIFLQLTQGEGGV